jgi:hypothetical protein
MEYCQLAQGERYAMANMIGLDAHHRSVHAQASMPPVPVNG